MSYDRDCYVEVAEGHPITEADAAWFRWLTAHPRTAATLDQPSDVVIDTGRYQDDNYTGTFRRYLVRSDAIDAAER